MPLKIRFKDKYAGSSPENASVVRTLFDLFNFESARGAKYREYGILCFILPYYHGCSQSSFQVFSSLPLVCNLNRSNTEAKIDRMIKLRT